MPVDFPVHVNIVNNTALSCQIFERLKFKICHLKSICRCQHMTLFNTHVTVFPYIKFVKIPSFITATSNISAFRLRKLSQRSNIFSEFVISDSTPTPTLVGATDNMPPKKKKAEEQKKKIIEDKTFGLKNKKKSKKVQQYVETVKKQATQKVDGPKRRGPGASGASAASSARMAQMAARLAELELMNQPVKEKQKKISPEEAEKKRLEEEAERERIRIANLPVEEQIEEERAKLTTKTPVTEELFLAWREEKKKERAAKEEAERAVAFKKMSKAERARGQGLTGRQLFQANADIFVDDENAVDEKLQPNSDYIGSDDEHVEDDVLVEAAADVTPGDASLFGGTELDNSAAGASSSQAVAVGVGDESLFS